MRRPSPFRIALAAAAMFGSFAAVSREPRPAAAQVLSGFDVFRMNCDGCHELPDPEDPIRTRKQWEEILTRMVKVRGATLDAQEFAAVLNYLDSFNRPKREIAWVEAPARSRQVIFQPADAGKLPPEWVDLMVGGEEPVPWAVQKDATGKLAYIQPLKPAAENQIPLLIDNSGILQNGAVSTRLQIVSGTGSVGAGVVFGFRSPQSFYGVRLGPRDVILYEVQAERALLGRSPNPTPLRQWQALTVEISGRSVRVLLNGKPLPELARSLPAYRGGRVGLHTQGNTVALFDRWQVQVK